MKILLTIVVAISTVGITLGQVPSYVPTNGLVGWWPFNGNANDASSSGNHGTVYGASLTSDRFSNTDNAYSFNGTSNYIQMINPGPLANSSRSVSLWVKTTTSAESIVVSWGNGDYKNFNIWSNYICSGINFDITGAGRTFNSAFRNGQWNHYVVVYDNSLGTSHTVTKIFENGVQLNTICASAGSGTINTASGFPISVGKWHQGNSYYLNGSIDDIGIWNRALTQTEITGLYQAAVTFSASASTVTNVSCFNGSNGSATVTPNGGTSPYTYSWNTVPVQTTLTATGLKAGTYTVTVTDSKGSMTTANATITQPNAITNVNASTVTNVNCFGGNTGSVTVTTPAGGTPPFTYAWNTNPVQLSQTASNLVAGTYTVTVTDSKGCTATSSATVTQPAQPLSNVVAQTTQNVKCKGSSTGIVTVSNPTGGTPPYSYKWNTTPIQTTKTAIDVPFGSYTVTVTDSNGCIATSTTNVTEPAPLTNVEAVVVRNVQCFGESNGSAKVTNPNGGTPPYSYSWNTIPIQTTQVATFLKAGEYVVTVTDFNGCLATSKVKITEPNIVPRPTITGEAIVCSKNTTSSFRVDPKSGYAITWSSPKNGRIIGSNTRDSVVVEWQNSGIDTVYVRYTDAQTGCFEETKKAVLIGNPLTPSIQGSASTCIDTVPTTYRTRYLAGQSYGWSKPRLGTIIGAINLDSVHIVWNASGQDTLILREFTIATGCFKDTSLIITVNPRPQPNISGKNQVIENEQGIVYSVTSDPGSTYDWSILSGDAEITKKNGHTIELNVGEPGTVIVKVIQTTTEGCKNETQQEIVVKSITGVKEEIAKSFSVYPNPNNGQEELIVELPSISHQEIRIELIDLLGIIRYEGMILSETTRHVIQLSDMPKGMYTIRLITQVGVLSEKVIVE